MGREDSPKHWMCKPLRRMNCIEFQLTEINFELTFHDNIEIKDSLQISISMSISYIHHVLQPRLDIPGNSLTDIGRAGTA